MPKANFKALRSFADIKDLWPQLPELSHVLQKDDYFVATNLYYALMIKFSAPEDNIFSNPAPKLIPTEIFTKLSASDDAVSVIGKWVVSTNYSTTLNPSAYPDYLELVNLIERDHSTRITCSKQSIKQGIDECKLTSETDGALYINIDNEELHITTKSDKLGQTTALVECNLSGKPLCTIAKLAYFKQCVTAIPGDEINIKFLLDEENELAMIQGVDKEVITIIALVRLEGAEND